MIKIFLFIIRCQK